MQVQPYLFFDGRCEEALAFYKKAVGAEIVAVATNVGYAAGVNLGARKATADVMVFMNDDVAVTASDVLAMGERVRSGKADVVVPLVENQQGELELAAEIPAKRFSSVSVGQPTTVKIIGVPEMTGRIRFASASIDPTTQLGQIRISLGDNSHLRMGTFARAIIDAVGAIAQPIRQPVMAYVLLTPEIVIVRSARPGRRVAKQVGRASP